MTIFHVADTANASPLVDLDELSSGQMTAHPEVIRIERETRDQWKLEPEEHDVWIWEVGRLADGRIGSRPAIAAPPAGRIGTIHGCGTPIRGDKWGYRDARNPPGQPATSWMKAGRFPHIWVRTTYSKVEGLFSP